MQLQADNPNIEFRMPTQGCMLFSDNMEIPVGAPNTAAALDFMNYVYDPKVAAKITATVQYVSPVNGVKQVLEKTDPALANNQLIFPSSVVHEELLRRSDPQGRRGDEGDGGLPEPDHRLIGTAARPELMMERQA